jgi:pilin/secretion family protein with methylation motif
MKTSRYGFTLIEVMLAMGLFMFGISALLGMFQFGGGMESAARTHSELAPAIQPLVRQIQAEAWMLDSSGVANELRVYFDQPVPGAPEFLYALDVQDAAESPNLRLARLTFYRKDFERVEASVSFLLTRRIPLARRLSETASR